MVRRHPSVGIARGGRSAAVGMVCAALGLVHGLPADAQTYPTRSIRLIVAFAPGGSLDRTARIIAPKLSDALGQQVVIDNRVGAGGNLAAEIAAKSAPDGYTLFLTGIGIVVNVSLYQKLNYDPLKDFAPITQLGSAHNVLVSHPSLPVRSVRDLVSLAKKLPGKIDFVSSGNGTSGHLAMELFKNLAGIELTHIPYKSIAQAQADLVAGQVPLFFPTIPGALPFIRSGRVIALGVSGTKRAPVLPEIPTVTQAGVPGYEASAWYPLLAPAGTPRAIVDRVQSQVAAVLHTPEMNKVLVNEGVEPAGTTPEQLAAHMRSELGKWARVVKAAGIQAQ
jgi:tripartite-type tricarboxylate transporter receptor subunit TctC